MRKEQKDQLITHLPMLSILLIFILIIIFPYQFGYYGMILIFLQFVIQGIVYMFYRNAHVSGGYLSKVQKLVFGMVLIAGGITMIILTFEGYI